MAVEIQPERSADAAAVRRVNERAFGGPFEANLVDALRQAGKAVVSLVARDGGRVVGHILFSPVTIIGEGGATWPAVGLAPMAVLPERQRQGIGSRLVEAGLAACRDLGHGAVVVLGHPGYYPRFGFLPARRFHLRSEYDAPEEAFMALELAPGALAGKQGLVRYSAELGTG